ncbi:MAG: efflux RND transporter permease subunit, partial [Deltaproteobacteria bacterium]|nr:efflux RND transporter permease subunit [Deltaproteobacteria bacterium]
MINTFHKKIPQARVGLALGSGSARGWAHIGVIRALAEAGIRVDYVAGTSIGALVGAVYASGEIDALEEVVLQLDWKQIVYFFDVILPKSGLIDGKKVSVFIGNNIKKINIEDLPFPFCAVSTDMNTGDEVAIQDGDIIEAVRASISVPGIFTPVKKNGTILVDGGIIMLMGIVVKNAIVLVDYTKQLKKRGMNLHDAIVNGGKTRLRPILMTSLTTIFGMTPLAISRGEGSEIWNALGITVISGLLISSIVTLVLIPLAYSVVHGY